MSVWEYDINLGRGDVAKIGRDIDSVSIRDKPIKGLVARFHEHPAFESLKRIPVNLENPGQYILTDPSKKGGDDVFSMRLSDYRKTLPVTIGPSTLRKEYWYVTKGIICSVKYGPTMEDGGITMGL